MKKIGFLSFRLIASLVGLAMAGGLVVVLAVVLVISPTLPSIDSLKDVHLKVPLRVYSADAKLIAEFGEERRIPVTFDQVPPLLVKAILAAEDDSFYQHQGVDLMGIVRAALANLRSGEHGQGASTITMQVARNYFLSPEKTYTRKIKEILLAFKIERALTKNQILELYVNKIFLGNRAYGFAAAAQVYYGRTLRDLTLPEMAMLAGLPKAPSRDNPLANPENARSRRGYVLSRMLKLGFIDKAAYQQAAAAPLTASRHLPGVDVDVPYVAEMVRHHMVQKYGDQAYTGGYKVYTTIQLKNQLAADRALQRGLMVYDRRHGYRGPAGHLRVDSNTSKDQLDNALKKYHRVDDLVPAVVLEIKEKSIGAYTRDGKVAHVGWEGMEWARRYVDVNHRGRTPKTAADILHLGDVVYLTRKRDEQTADEKAVAEKNGDDKTANEWELAQVPAVSGALVSLRPYDGAVLALCGGFNYYLSKFNRATQAERQPGSNIKPFIYSAALEKGFTAASRISGAPIVVKDPSLEDVWRPENYSGKFFGPTRLREALTHSLNLVSIRLLRAIGPAYAVDYLTRFGFEKDKLPKNLSLALGTASLTPLEVATGFAVFANGGYKISPYFISRVEDGDGKIVEQAHPAIVCPSCLDAMVDRTDDDKGATGGDLPRYAQPAITPQNAFIMTTMMQDVITSGTGRGALVLHRSDLAGKTGTTNNYRDAWFSGFNHDVQATVWVGFDQPTSLGRGEFGGRAALPIWIDYMRVALDGDPQKPLVPPEGVTTAYINRDTSQPTTEDDPDGYQEYFMAGVQEGPDIAAEPGVENPNPVPPVRPGQLPPPEKKIPEGLF
jgi:penicillin-binding protein 1A